MTADAIWGQAVREAMQGERQDSRNGPVMEMLGFQSEPADPRSFFVWNPGRRLSPIYAAGEMLWYMSGSDDGDHIMHYAPSYHRFLNDGKAMGAYGTRIFQTMAWQDVCRELIEGESRRAVIPVFGLKDLRNTRPGIDCKDIPCTLDLQFHNRDGAVHCITNMRSNDVWFGLPYDSFCFMLLQLMICEHIGADPGFYIHQAGSMHAYERQWSKLADQEKNTWLVDFEPYDDYEINIAFKSEIPTLHRIGAIAADERINRKSQTFKGKEWQFAYHYGAFSIATTLLTLASLQNYDDITDKEMERMYQFCDGHLIDQAAEIVRARAEAK